MKELKIIESIKINPDKILNDLSEKELKKIIDFLSDKYFNESESVISDQLFDYIKEYYEINFKKKIEIGANLKLNKVKLPYYMGSLDKVKPATGVIEKWVKNYPGPYVVSYKLDGISALLCKENNKVSMYTRGNGVEGRDISHCIKDIGINITKLANGDAIRGELIISKNNFKKIEDKMANARAGVSGIIGTKNPEPKILKLVDFVAYWVLNPELTIIDQLKYIESKDFVPRSVEYKVYEKLDVEKLSEMLIKGREAYKYVIDGLVIIDNSKIYLQEEGSNPNYGFAFKQLLTDQIAEATVIDVIWEITKDKFIKPKVKLNTVELLGSEINYATANNAKFVVDNKLGPGSVVQIIKAGDVIPKIEKILKPSDTKKPKLPSIKYEWNETGVDFIAVDLDEESMKKIIIKKLAYFFSSLDIPLLAETTLEKFVNNGYNDIWKILNAKKEDLYEIEGLGKKSIDKIYEGIDKGLTNRFLYDIMNASCLLGRGIGKKKFKAILTEYPNILDIFKTKGKAHTTQLINNISGFDNKTTSKIIDNLPQFIKYYDKLLKIKPNLINKNKTDLFDKINKTTNNKLKKYEGQTIVFTGFRDKNIENELEKNGSKITNSVSKNTDLVIADDINETSTKIIKAKELKIKLISKDEFYKSIKEK